MATTYGAPTNLDLSACTLSTDGGKTNQTLAALGTAVAGNATAVAAAQADATDAKTQSAQASSDATDAKTAVENLGTTYIAQTEKDATGGVVAYDSTGAAVIQSLHGTNNADTFLAIGSWPEESGPASGQVTVAYRFDGVNTTNLYYKSNNISYQLFSGFNTVACPDVDGGISIAEAGRAVSGIYSQTAVTVTSDARRKTLIGALSDTTYTDGQKLSDAIFGIDTEIFKLNSSIAEKGAADARLHAGFIAQKIEAAITASGLDPHDYALWTESPVYETIKTDTGKTDDSGHPIYSVSSQQQKDTDGTPLTIQMLRYEQIFAVLHDAYKLRLSALDARVSALEAKATTAATATTTTTTTGSAG